MKALKWIFDFYVNSSIHVSLAVAALTWITCLHFGLPVRSSLLLFVFFGSVTGYNFVKYAGIAKLHHRSLARNLRAIQVFSLLCFIALAYFTLQVSLTVLLVAVILGLLTLLYALPVFNKRNLRTVTGIKVYVIALIWAGVGVLFPVAEMEYALDIAVAAEFFQRFLFVLVLLLPFEIRDLKYDPAELGTLPQKYGIKRTKQLGFNILGFILLLELFKGSLAETFYYADLPAYCLTVFLLLKSKEDSHRYYTTFLVEGIPLIWLLLLLLSGTFS